MRGPQHWPAPIVNLIVAQQRSTRMTAVWMSRVPTVLSLQQLVEQAGPPAKQTMQVILPAPTSPVSAYTRAHVTML